jgi:hypothetical protein
LACRLLHANLELRVFKCLMAILMTEARGLALFARPVTEIVHILKE